MKNLKIYALLTSGVVLSGAIGFLVGQEKGSHDLYQRESIEMTSTKPEVEDSSAEDQLETLIEKVVQKKTESMALDNTSSLKKSSYQETAKKVAKEATHESMVESETDFSSFEDSSESTEQNLTDSFENFEGELQEVNQFISSSDQEAIAEKGENYVQSGIDFVLHGKELHGVTFDELTEKGKQETIDNLYRMYGLITGTDPYYKEQFGDDFKQIINQEKEETETSTSMFQTEFRDALQKEAENIRYALKKIKSETEKESQNSR